MFQKKEKLQESNVSMEEEEGFQHQRQNTHSAGAPGVVSVQVLSLYFRDQ